MNIHVITIDGPSGSGKGTLATKIAQHYHYHLLDSGALYRLLGLSLQRQNLITKIHENLIDCVNIARNLHIEFLPTSQGIQVVLDREDVSQVIRTEEVGAFASKVAVVPELRVALLQRQRDFAQTPGVVADGRDMGTVVFPHAQAKLYLTATAQSRAERRAKQLQSMGEDAKIADILANIQARDKRDMEREVAPLKPAVDALVIDSSYLTIDEVFMQMVNYIDVQLAKTL